MATINACQVPHQIAARKLVIVKCSMMSRRSNLQLLRATVPSAKFTHTQIYNF